MIERCPWPGNNQLMIEYHDKEWGVPLRDERKHFEFLLLEFFQAGLSWLGILNKRENFRKAFDDFDPEIIASYSDAKINMLMDDPGIIRNRRKIEASRHNAGLFLKTAEEFGSFDEYIWHFSGGKPIINQCEKPSDIPTTSPLSDEVAADLKKRGFKFVGPVTIYAHLQAIGVVNDHLISCFRHAECAKM